MTNRFLSLVFLSIATILTFNPVQAATKTASVRIDSTIKHQRITGFGGFVCSPQFGYNHMSETEIRRVWGKTSDAGYNIMRLYIPEGKSGWSQSLATAKLAQSLGLIIFASPWTMPAEWKTNNHIAAVYTDANGVEQVGYLKEEHYADYANYLNDYVTYLRTNGVNLEAISIQNEPDMRSSYHGCIWTPDQMATFIKRYGYLINCKIMASDGVGMSDNYVNAFNNDSVLAQLDYFAGHQYGYIQSGFKKLQAKGLEAWMTEYLINWNDKQTTGRNFNWNSDAFTFAAAVNNALLANVNAWIHYATKRFYGLMGDGTYGTPSGVISKRGHILSHYAQHVTGKTRIECLWKDDSGVLTGSSYLSSSGDTIVLVVMNPSTDSYTLTLDIPFYTQNGRRIKTTASLNKSVSVANPAEETCRPSVTIDPSSVNTVYFVKSKDRAPSRMSSKPAIFSPIDQQTPSSTTFGTGYKLSGKTATFDHSNSLISANTTTTNGYLRLDDTYTKLVLHVKSLTTAATFTSANTTLYYLNAGGAVRSYNYGTVTYNPSGNQDWTIDLSRNVLTEGCTGILGITNGNWTSVLRITFGDVYFLKGDEKGRTFTGIYSGGDSDLLDCLEDPSCTVLDFTNTDSLPATENWQAVAANKNMVYYLPSGSANQHPNVVNGTTCNNLVLSGESGGFMLPTAFSATAASYSHTINDYAVLTLPFKAALPEGLVAYTLSASPTAVTCSPLTGDSLPAHTPVLIQGSGSFTYHGAGTVSTPKNQKINNLNPVYLTTKAAVGSYFLSMTNGTPVFQRVASGTEPTLSPFTAFIQVGNLTTSAASLPLEGLVTGLDQVRQRGENAGDGRYYDLFGRRVEHPRKGIYIRNGQKVVFQ